MSESVESFPDMYADNGYASLIENLGNPSAMPLIKNSNGTIVRHAEYNNELFIVRSPYYTEVDVDDPIENETIQKPYEAFEHRILALREALGVVGLEQMVCYSLPEEVVVTRHAGIPMDEITIEDAEQIDTEEWEKLFAAMETACDKGLLFDFGSASNLVYGPSTGLTIIDFGRQKDDDGIYKPTPASEFEQLVLLMVDEISVKNGRENMWRAMAQSALSVLDRHYPNGSEATVHKTNIDRVRPILDVA